MHTIQLLFGEPYGLRVISIAMTWNRYLNHKTLDWTSFLWRKTLGTFIRADMLNNRQKQNKNKLKRKVDPGQIEKDLCSLNEFSISSFKMEVEMD